MGERAAGRFTEAALVRRSTMCGADIWCSEIMQDESVHSVEADLCVERVSSNGPTMDIQIPVPGMSELMRRPGNAPLKFSSMISGAGHAIGMRHRTNSGDCSDVDELPAPVRELMCPIFWRCGALSSWCAGENCSQATWVQESCLWHWPGGKFDPVFSVAFLLYGFGTKSVTTTCDQTLGDTGSRMIHPMSPFSLTMAIVATTLLTFVGISTPVSIINSFAFLDNCKGREEERDT
eukprot:1997173-Rhodomonas_salina.4